MDFKDLRYVLAVAEHQNITKAAQSLFVTQPNLTKFIKKHEMELGLKIFKRLGNRFCLTFAGEKYVEKAKQILELKRQLDLDLSELRKQNIGELRISFSGMRAIYLVPATIPVFSQRYPNMKVIVKENSAEMVEQMIMEGRTDLAFMNGLIFDSNIDYQVLSAEEVVLLVSGEHPLANQGVWAKGCRYPWIDIKRFQSTDFILQFPKQSLWTIANNLFQERHMQPNVYMYISNTLVAANMVASNLGACFITEDYLDQIDLKNKVVCFSVGSPSTIINFVAAYRRGGYIPEYAEDYIKMVSEFIGTKTVGAKQWRKI